MFAIGAVIAKEKKMSCPDCGADMYHHKVKIDYGIDDPAILDSVFGGASKEVHACPRCGRTELRAA